MTRLTRQANKLMLNCSEVSLLPRWGTGPTETHYSGQMSLGFQRHVNQSDKARPQNVLTTVCVCKSLAHMLNAI